MYTVVKFFLSRPLLQWKKRGKNWKNVFELNKQVNIRKSTLLNVKQKTSKNTAKFSKIRTNNVSQNYVYTFKNQREIREVHRNEKWKRKINIF